MRAVRSIVKSLAERKEVSRETKWDFAEVSDLPANALRDRRRPNNRVLITSKDMRKLIKKTKPNLTNPLLCSHRALLLVLGTTGMRIGEAINMQVDDIAKVEGGYIVRNVMSKHDADPRVVPLSEEAFEAIQDWLHIRPVQSNYVFIACTRTRSEESDGILWNDTPMCRTSAYRVVRKYGKAIGMPNIKPHDFRRFVGTQLTAKKNIRVAQKVLGHASIQTTAKHYVLDDTPIGSTEKLF
jgi:integrase